MEEVDDFTQKFLQNAEQRSKKLGISSMSKIPLTESNTKATPSRQNSTKSPKRSASNKLQSTTPSSARKVAVRKNSSAIDRAREVNIESKENADLALEINITTGPNVQVQVQVDEQEIDSDGNVLKTIQSQRKQITSIEHIEDTKVTPSKCIRDSSKNQLDRLGALYSNPQALSSPVHRTEPAFTTEQERERRNVHLNRNNRFAKLNELTKFYNECDDEIKPQTNNSLENGGHTIDGTDAKASPKPATKMNEKKMVETNKRNVNSPQKTSTGTINKTISNRFAPKETATETNDNKKASDKQVVWDKRVMDSLEAQGFKRRDTTYKRLEYNFNYKGKASPKKDNVVEQKLVPKLPVAPTTTSTTSVATKTEATTMAANKKGDISKGLVSGRAAIFETSQITLRGGSAPSSARNQKDPTELSLKERMALFEKNKGTALMPKAALGIAPSMKQIQNENNKMAESSKPVITTPQQPMIARAPSNAANSPSKINNFNKAVVADTNAGGQGIRHTVAALLNNPATISESRIANETRKLREQEMNVVLNRFNNKSKDAEPASPPPAPPMPENLFATNSSGRKRLSGERRERHEISPQVMSSLEDVKRVRVNPPKSGHIYPTLSDIESTESEKNQYTDDDNNEQPMLDSSRSEQDEEEAEDSYMDSDSSYQHERRKDERHVHYENSMTSADSDNDMDKYLEAAFDNSEDDDDRRESLGHKKGTVSSNSFSFERKPLNRQTETIFEDEATTSFEGASRLHSPIQSKLTVNPSDDNNTVTLTHTVSFYRRQQTQNASPAVRKVVNHKLDFESADETTDADTEIDDLKPENGLNQTQEALVQDKIKSLMNNIIIQQQKIAQASNALNTCASTVEFSGSTESVVAEWSLLVATHCRQAALNEMSRLKVERCLRPADAPKECGRLTVKEITLPLNQEYISKLSTDKIPGHNLVCLLKYNEHVLATKTMPTLPGLLSVKFQDVLQLDNVYADFKVTLEIYGMTAPREFLPHEIKYHINKNSKKGVLKTPKKGKKCGSNLIMPPVQSPAGPSAIRSPSFISYGFAIFSLREAQRNSWTLNQMSNVSPLVGTVHMKVNCALSVNIDHRGFLTMFEDASGFGAWHRRWCRLHGNMLSYWKYPDDERKPPIGTLDLTSCQQQKITTAPREVCARMNTLLIEMKRPRQVDDQDSFRLQVSGDYTIVRHLLSADTKEDQFEWCAHFNKTLALMRAWGNSQR